MKEPQTATGTAGTGVSLKREGSKGPRTPSANRLASQQQQARVERGETVPASAPFSQSARAWRTGGDRKIMFENRVGHALIPEAKRPVSLVATMNVCAWLLLAMGLFQVVVSKLSKFKWPLHWIGVLMMFLGLVTMGVRIYTNRCGTSPQWVGAIALVTIVACLTTWLVADGPLYKEMKRADNCSEDELDTLCPGYDCVCKMASSLAGEICVEFDGNCEDVTSNRRYLLMSLISLWTGMGLSFIVVVVAGRILSSTFDAGAVIKAEEKQRMKDKKVAMAKEPPAPPFGV